MRRFISRLKSENGFSMLEVVISVAGLALIAGFILQMFIVSSKVNQRSADKDQATRICENTLEQTRANIAKGDSASSSAVDSDNFTVTTVIKIVGEQKNYGGKLYEITVSVRDGDNLKDENKGVGVSMSARKFVPE